MEAEVAVKTYPDVVLFMVIAIAGVVVGFVTIAVRKLGTVADTVVTVPVPGDEGVVHVAVTGDVFVMVSTWFNVGEPAIARAIVPAPTVMGEEDTDRNDGAEIPTEVIPPPPPPTAAHEVFPDPSVVRT